MVQNSTIGSVSVDNLVRVLGADIAVPDLSQLQTQTQILTILPGTSFWRSSDRQPGIYMILAGKVRLFDLHGKRVATLTVGRSFGESTLFPDADFSHYIAKAALVVGGAEIVVGFIPSDCLGPWWDKYPVVKNHLSQRAQHLDAILRGEMEPSALQVPQRGLQQPPLAARELRPLSPVTPGAAVAKPAPQGKAGAAGDRFKEAYFPTPSQKMGNGGKRLHTTTHSMPNIVPLIVVLPA